MPLSGEQLDQLLRRPSETLNSETKTWFDLRTPHGKAKLVRALFALRNRNGGTFVMGFNDKTLEPDPYGLEVPVQELVTVDTVHGIISTYATQSFEVGVHLHELDGVPYPVLSVPTGVTVPVIVRSDLPNPEKAGKFLIQEGDLYFRTLASNGTPSSSKIKPGDYRDLLDVCFENREADIGRFLRRHLGGGGDALRVLSEEARLTLRARCEQLTARGEAAYVAAAGGAADGPVSPGPDILTMRVAMCLDPMKDDALPTGEFLNAFTSGNPAYTGWPVWLDTRGFRDRQAHPFVKDGSWQALVREAPSGIPDSDFMLLDPRGDFFLRRVMQDDFRANAEARRLLDPGLMLDRVAEVFAVGLAVAKATGWTADAKVGFRFHWSGLADRRLGAWANPFWMVPSSGYSAHDSEAAAFAELSLDTSASALAPFVAAATGPLFAAFGGYTVAPGGVEDAVKQLLARRL
ncbi:hypothetical protein [Pseudoroseomonas ludipueritiae]|uniref:ATP-binding protein n=1 Tax=Pseudoroseomonas ludipueritiae TaxID=198093 RepID=A0ABR7RCH9_9PROT|nr:hypothetical protein [Pseudoroseomonas ludipueritiae]MBC9179480.1 hypothetical protein [Pseudoroseomonas ludipueritiae]